MMKEEVIRAVLKEELLINCRSVVNIFRDRRPELYGPICAPLSEPYKPPNAIAPGAEEAQNKPHEM